MRKHILHIVLSCIGLPLFGACAVHTEAADEELASASEELSSKFEGSTIGVVGSLEYGQTSAEVDHTGWPRYRGFSFIGQGGDHVESWVRAKKGRAKAWLLDDKLRVLSSNDATSTPSDAQLTLDLPGAKSATFYIVFRDANDRRGQFTVSLDGKKACSPKTCATAAATCGSIPDGCGKTVDCGACASGTTCGGGGTPNVCGAPTPPPPPPPCTWSRRFGDVYGQTWQPGDVAFRTGAGSIVRGMDKLNLEASRSTVPDNVYVLGSSAKVSEILLYKTGTTSLLASRAGAYIYGLGDAMWHQVNGYSASTLVEETLIRLLTERELTYAELTEQLRVLTSTISASLVPAADKADYLEASTRLMKAIDAGTSTFKLGTGHAIDFWQTAQTVNGKTFSYQFSNAFGLDPKLGLQRNGVWGPFWPTNAIVPLCK